MSGASRQLTNTPSNGWRGMRWNRRKNTKFSARWQQGKRSLNRPYFPRLSVVKEHSKNGVQEAVSSTLATRTKQGPSDQPVKRTVKRKFHGPFAISAAGRHRNFLHFRLRSLQGLAILMKKRRGTVARLPGLYGFAPNYNQVRSYPWSCPIT